MCIVTVLSHCVAVTCCTFSMQASHCWHTSRNKYLKQHLETNLFVPALSQAVHPDKTLRKSKRTAPRMRPSVPMPPAPPKTTQTNKLASWLSGGEVRREEEKMEGDTTKKA